jgi:hypothetical protein
LPQIRRMAGCADRFSRRRAATIDIGGQARS